MVRMLGPRTWTDAARACAIAAVVAFTVSVVASVVLGLTQAGNPLSESVAGAVADARHDPAIPAADGACTGPDGSVAQVPSPPAGCLVDLVHDEPLGDGGGHHQHSHDLDEPDSAAPWPDATGRGWDGPSAPGAVAASASTKTPHRPD
jgi:hypothetical protein